MKNKLFTILVIILTASYASAEQFQSNYNYSLEDNNESCNDLEDPFEAYNRKAFFFNSFIDHITLKPIAKVYNKFLSDYAKNRVGDFVANIYEPVTTINYGLQGNLDGGLKSFWRFIINSVYGVGGTYDLATDVGLTATQQGFGSTLAHYGVSSGPYIVIPFIGSSNMRDMWDLLVFDNALNPLRRNLNKNFNSVYTITSIVSRRAEIMPFTDYISKNSTDPYVSIRSALHQRRESVLVYPKGYVCGVKPSRLMKDSN
jgi:phospholipid-binding lipoprotein MlaA